jgi:hypoxanthine-guanine phosphoribosyltransferase
VFVVGYGLDFNDDFRHLPYVGVLEEHQGGSGLASDPRS